jgi:hypothetical protein
MGMQIYDPILVIVSGDRWDAFSLNHEPLSTERDRFLLSEIKLAGGIDETVPPGAYHFNVIPFNGIDHVTLLPVQH